MKGIESDDGRRSCCFGKPVREGFCEHGGELSWGVRHEDIWQKSTENQGQASVKALGWESTWHIYKRKLSGCLGQGKWGEREKVGKEARGPTLFTGLWVSSIIWERVLGCETLELLIPYLYTLHRAIFPFPLFMPFSYLLRIYAL